MAAPTLISVYPANGDTGIPVGSTIKLYFDYGVDEQSVKESVILYGSDFDFTSGPESAVWVDKDTGDNPFFLSSPGFKGVVPLKFEFSYFSLGSVPGAEVSAVITTQEDEVDQALGMLVKVRLDPKYNAQLAPDLLYTLIVTGDPDNQNVGVSARTVFDPIKGADNKGSGELFLWGTWQGGDDNTLYIEITKSGNIGTAEYKYNYFGSTDITRGRVTNRRFRTLRDGLQIRFTGSNFQEGDSWTINLSPVERMQDNIKYQFTTNDGSYSEAPESPSTPASSTPPLSILPSATNAFEVIDMDPAVGAYNVSLKNRTITITFSEAVDPETITNTSIRLWKYPVSGVYEDTFSPIELQKILSVDGDQVTIEF